MLRCVAISVAWTALTSFDWFLLLMVAISTLLAFHRGIVRVLFSLAGLVVGILVASWYFLAVATWLQRWVTSLPVAEIVAFVAILMGVTILFSAAAGVVRRTVRAVGLGFVDRLLGAGFGLVRGVLFGVALMMAMAAFFPGSGWIRNSVMAPYFLGGAHAVSLVVPEHFRVQVSAGARHLKEKSPDLLKPDVPDR